MNFKGLQSPTGIAALVHEPPEPLIEKQQLDPAMFAMERVLN